MKGCMFKKSVIRQSYLLPLLLLVMLLAGCKTSKVVKTAPVEPAYLSSKLQLTVPNKNGSITVSGSMKMKSGERIQLSVLMPVFRSEVMRMEVTPDEVLLIDRMNKRYVRATRDELKELLPENADFDRLEKLLFKASLPGEKKEGWMEVRGFAEKPDEEQAEKLMEQGALWNCGVFCVRIGDILERAKKYGVPEDYQGLCASYEKLPKISFDYEVLEKAEHLAAVEFRGFWKDLGTWDALADQMSTDTIGNVVLDETCENTQVINELKMPVAVMGTRDLVVVASQDGILVTDKNQTARVKEIASGFSSRPMFEERRWGTLETLDDTESQGKATLTRKIHIYDGMTSSYHYHQYRDEIWTVLSGTGELILEGTKIPLSQGKAVCIRKNQRHAVKAFRDFEYIEIHVGTSTGSDDINRITFNWDEIELSHIL